MAYPESTGGYPGAARGWAGALGTGGGAVICSTCPARRLHR